MNTPLPHDHNTGIVIVAIFIAIFASYAALDLAGRVSTSRGAARYNWLLVGSIAMGLGIWSMHFTAMLAFILPISVAYDIPGVVLSLLVAIGASCLALYIVSRQELGWIQFGAGGIVMGIAIATMHYIGMAAMRLKALLSYEPVLFTISILIAITASIAALWLAYRFRSNDPMTFNKSKIASAIVMGAAISGMHFTGMHAAIFTPANNIILDLSRSVNISLLGAASIAIGTFVILTVTLIFSMLDRRFAWQATQMSEQEIQHNQALEKMNIDLQRHVTDLQLMATISNTLSTILEEPLLIKSVVQQVQQTFKYDHVHIYMVDETKENLALKGATGEVGKLMLEATHKVKIGERLVGRVVRDQLPLYVSDIHQDPRWLPYSMLPETKAEVSVPIIIADEVAGVLDIQQNTAQTLSQRDIDLLMPIANQIGIAIQNARLFQAQEKLTAELQQSSNFLNSVLDNLPLMLFVKEAENLRFVRWNKASEDLTGFTHEEVIGKNDYDFFPKEEADFFTAKDREVLSQGTLVDIPEEPIETSHRGTRFLRTHKVPISGADGQPQYLLGISEDITEQKQVETQLESRVQQLNLLSEIGRKTEETADMAEFLHWICTRIPTVVSHPDICVAAITLDDKTYGNPQAISLPRQIVEGLRIEGNLVGRIYIAYTEDHVFGDEESALIGNIGQRVANYIETQRLDERARLLVSLVENNRDFIGIGSLSGNVIYINPAGLDMAGYPADYDVQNKNISLFFSPEDANLLAEQGFANALQSGYWSSEARLLRADGSTLPVEETISVNYDAVGQPVSFSITMRDITERQETAEVLLKQAKELQIVTEVGTAAAAAKDAMHLLQTVVDLTQQGFSLYHAHIFLLDNQEDNLYLASGAGEIGQYLLQENLTIPLRAKKSLVAQAARTRQGVVASSVQEEPDYLPHPLLPETRSELAVPLVAGDQFLGVLDVQANETGYFTLADLPVYMTLATQVAVALQNVRQYEATQRALAEVQSLQSSLTREGWRTFMTARERPIRGFRANGNEVEPINENNENIEETAVITPVNILGQAIGGLAVRGNVSAEDQALLQAISQQVGQALERSRLAEQTQVALSETEQQALRLAQLNEMASAINTAATLDEMMRIVAGRANIILNSQRATIRLLDKRTQTLQLHALEGEIDFMEQSVPVSDTVMGTALRESRIVITNDLSQSNYPHHKQLFEAGLWATMVAPLVATTAIGTLNVSSTERQAFNQNDENLLLQIASLVASAIESRRLFVEVEDRAAELAVLNEVAHVVSQQLELKQLFSAVHEQVQRAILSNAFFVAMYNAEDNLIHFPYMYDDGEIYEAAPIKPDPNIEVTQVIQSGVPILKTFTEAEQQQLANESEHLMGSERMPYSMIFVPLRSATKAVGAISVQIYEPHQYTEADVALLNGIANHLSVAMENARLFAEVQRRAERERLVNEITQKIQGTTSMESALQTAVSALGQALKAKHTEVVLTVGSKTNGAKNGSTEERAYEG